MRLRSLLFAGWYESPRGLASTLKGSFTKNLPSELRRVVSSHLCSHLYLSDFDCVDFV